MHPPVGEASAAETFMAGGEFMVGLWRTSGCVYILCMYLILVCTQACIHLEVTHTFLSDSSCIHAHVTILGRG